MFKFKSANIAPCSLLVCNLRKSWFKKIMNDQTIIIETFYSNSLNRKLTRRCLFSLTRRCLFSLTRRCLFSQVRCLRTGGLLLCQVQLRRQEVTSPPRESRSYATAPRGPSWWSAWLGCWCSGGCLAQSAVDNIESAVP